MGVEDPSGSTKQKARITEKGKEKGNLTKVSKADETADADSEVKEDDAPEAGELEEDLEVQAEHRPKTKHAKNNTKHLKKKTSKDEEDTMAEDLEVQDEHRNKTKHAKNNTKHLKKRTSKDEEDTMAEDLEVQDEHRNKTK